MQSKRSLPAPALVTFAAPNVARAGAAAFASRRSYFFCGYVADHFGRFGNYPDWRTLRGYFKDASQTAARRIANGI